MSLDPCLPNVSSTSLPSCCDKPKSPTNFQTASKEAEKPQIESPLTALKTYHKTTY